MSNNYQDLVAQTYTTKLGIMRNKNMAMNAHEILQDAIDRLDPKVLQAFADHLDAAHKGALTEAHLDTVIKSPQFDTVCQLAVYCRQALNLRGK